MEKKQAGNLIRAQGQQIEHDAGAAVQKLIRNDYQEYGILDCLKKMGDRHKESDGCTRTK